MAQRIVTTLPNIEFTIADGNFDTTRKPIDRIIIHTTVSSAQSAIAHFGDPNAQVSAHYIVGLDGKIYHGLEETYTAYHAGNYAMNQRSIGIEHEDNGDYNGVRPDALYTTSAKLVRDICNFYNIPIDRQHILKHSEVKATGCPDALDIDRIVREAAGTPTPTPNTAEHDRDVNWNLFNFLCTLLGVEVNANDKEATKQRAADKITQLQTQAAKASNLEQVVIAKDTEREMAVEQAKSTLNNQFTIDKNQWLTKEKDYLKKINDLQKKVDGKIPTTLSGKIAYALKILGGK